MISLSNDNKAISCFSNLLFVHLCKKETKWYSKSKFMYFYAASFETLYWTYFQRRARPTASICNAYIIIYIYIKVTGTLQRWQMTLTSISQTCIRGREMDRTHSFTNFWLQASCSTARRKHPKVNKPSRHGTW